MRDPVVFYFDFVSPFAYVGSVAIERLGSRLQREVEWRPVLIGITILKIMGMKPLPETPLKGPYLARDLQRLAAFFDVPVQPHGLKGVNSVQACRAFLHIGARDAALGKAFAQAIFHRLWIERLDITQMEHMLEVADQIGADGPGLRSYLESEDAKVALRDAVDGAVATGVFGVPTFIGDGEMFWGNDHLWMLEHWLTKHRFTPS